MTDKDITTDDLMGAILALGSKIDALDTKVEAGFKEASDERQAIRTVVDDLPGMSDMKAVEGDVVAVKSKMDAMHKDVRQIASEQRRIVSRLDRAKVPV